MYDEICEWWGIAPFTGGDGGQGGGGGNPPPFHNTCSGRRGREGARNRKEVAKQPPGVVRGRQGPQGPCHFFP